MRLAPRDVAMFRFLLEAEDNLAFMTTVDRWACVVCVVFSPHHAAAVRRYLETMREAIPFDVILASRDPDTGALPGGATDSRS
ncbi:MAG: DUF4911 domain-containing protein [Deltaproteobacteria bacterium]|nr:DUF4911 domain-containing protein [Deltaproteobacteria bacterium]